MGFMGFLCTNLVKRTLATMPLRTLMFPGRELGTRDPHSLCETKWVSSIFGNIGAPNPNLIREGENIKVN